MIVPEESALGLLLAVSSFLLFLSAISYRRSGVRILLGMVVGFAAHVVFTVSILVILSASDWLDGIDRFQLVVVDALVLVFVLVTGLAGGRVSGGPP